MLDLYIRGLRLHEEHEKNIYPYNLPIFKNFERIDFENQVTFIIGENGMGKSTIVEAIAVAYGFNPEGGNKNLNFSNRDTHSELYDYIVLEKGFRMAKQGFFLRAESFYNVATEIDILDEGAPQDEKIINSFGGISLHEQSHGESFFNTFLHKFSERGMYILDEPEAALSPLRQLAMLRRINELVEKKAQFIIATHSPILMAYPNAIIYELSEKGIQKVNYEDTEHYFLTKRFINDPSSMMDELFK